MTNNNQYYLNKLPETTTVSYYDVETEQNLTQEEWNQLHQNNFGGITVIDKSGDNFISEKDGYGPCSNSKCYGSNACLSGEVFFDLRVPCPTERCRKNNRGVISWTHAKYGCGYSTSKLSNKARIRCPDCFTTSHMKYHSFACELHRGEYESTSHSSFSDALFVAYNNNEIPSDVFMDLLSQLRSDSW